MPENYELNPKILPFLIFQVIEFWKLRKKNSGRKSRLGSVPRFQWCHQGEIDDEWEALPSGQIRKEPQDAVHEGKNSNFIIKK